jgi:hypothetical protein
MKKRIIIITLAVLLVASGLLVILLPSSPVFHILHNTVTVSFETNGGSKIDPVPVPMGKALTTVPVPAKADNVFIGWYTDKELTQAFYSDTAIAQNTTLYAAYTPTQLTQREFVEPNQYLADCKPDVSVSIRSAGKLTAENLRSYVDVTSITGELPELNVTGDGDVYTLSPATPYSAGAQYRFTLLDDGMAFEGQDGAVRELTLRIHKDDVSNIKLKDNIIYVLWADVKTLENGNYSVPTDPYTVKTGDTVCFWNGQMDKDALVLKVLATTAVQDAGEKRTLLHTQDGSVEDLFDGIDVYFEQGIPADQLMNGIDTAAIAEQARNSEAAKRLTAMLARSIGQSPTVQALLADGEPSGGGNSLQMVGTNLTMMAAPAALNLAAKSADRIAAGLLSDDPFEPVTEEGPKVPLPLGQSLLDGLTVSAYTVKVKNPNFPAASYADWCSVVLTFQYETTIKDKVQINAKFTVRESFSASLQGYHQLRQLYNMEFDYAANLYSQTDMDLTVLIKSKDTEEDEYFNITDEIEKLTGGNEEEQEDPSGILQSVLGAKGDDLELVNAKLSTVQVNIIPQVPVAQLQIDLDFVVRMNFAAGLSAHTTIMSSRQIGLSRKPGEGVDSYSYPLSGNGRYSFDMYCAGYIGAKAGLRASFSVAFLGLSELGRMGMSGEVGAFLDVYGFAHFNVSKPREYGGTTTSAQGGLYLETGIYVRLDIFVISETFKLKAEANILKLQFPILTLGDRYILKRFVNPDSVFLMRTDSQRLQGSAGLFDAEFIDLTTGNTVTGSYADPSRFAIQFSNASFALSQDKSTMVVNKQPGALRLEANVTLYYTGGSLAFSLSNGMKTARTIRVVWVDPGVDMSASEVDKTFKVTYAVDIQGKRQVIAEKDVFLYAIPGGVDLSAYQYTHQTTGYTGDWNKPIQADTEYVVHMAPYQKYVTFLSFYEDAWHMDVYAVNAGELPQPPPQALAALSGGTTLTGWTGKAGWHTRWLANEPPVNRIVPVELAQLDINMVEADTQQTVVRKIPLGTADYQFTGLDTTKPVFSKAYATLEEAQSALNTEQYQGAAFADSSYYYYTAQYAGGEYSIHFVYPDMSYTAWGHQYRDQGWSYDKQFHFGEQIYPGTLYPYPGCNMAGWDADADGKADYEPFRLPVATQDMTFRAVMEIRRNTVTLLDADGELDRVLTVNEGDLPSVLTTIPQAPEGYAFKEWQLSRNGGEFAKWDRAADPGVYDDTWRIMPVFEKVYTVTFDYAGGSYAGKTSETVHLIAGTYRVADYTTAYPSKEKDLRSTYRFAGWSCGERFTVEDDMTITAQYTSSDRIYEATFRTGVGRLSNGETQAVITGNYDAISNFLAQNSPLATVYTNEKIYTFQRWAGSIGAYDQVVYNAQWSEAVRTYTLTFDAGEGAFSSGEKTFVLTLTYGSTGEFPGGAQVGKPADVYTTYKLKEWRDADGNSYAPSDTWRITKDTTFTAIYEVDGPVVYTIDINAGGGWFSDHTDTPRVYTGTYGQPTNITLDDPIPPEVAGRHYTFLGWSHSIPTTFTQNMTITARWSEAFDEYTVTFNAGAGAFAGGGATVTQTYHYGDTITPPASPARAPSGGFTYAFIGWSPSLAAVTEDADYTATYRATYTGGLEATGIFVSDGTNTEDINSSGHGLVAGYAYGYVDHDEYPETDPIPLLTITGNGLTVSGESGVGPIYVKIASDAGSVTLSGLTLRGAYADGDGALYIENGAGVVTINISGNCTIANTANNYAMYIGRSVKFQGTGSGASLSVTSNWRGIAVMSDLEAANLTMNVTAPNDFPFFYDGVGGVWRFNNVALTAQGARGLSLTGSIVIKGDKNVRFSASVAGEPALSATLLRFEDFTGDFQATAGSGAAVIAGAIEFDAPASYGLHGAEVRRETFDDGYGGTYDADTFVASGTDTPVSSVRVSGS